MRYQLLLALAPLAACNSQPEPEARAPGPAPTLSGDLTPEAQEARLNACRDLMQAEFGELTDDPKLVIRAQPMVSPSAFLRLSDTEEERFVELSACNGASGMIGQREVVILSSVSGAEVSTMQAANNIDWAAE